MGVYISRKILIILVTIISVNSLYSQSSIVAKVIKVISGDTILVKDLYKDQKERLIKLCGLECPKLGQAYFTNAKRFTLEKILNKTISYSPKERIYINDKLSEYSKEITKAHLSYHTGKEGWYNLNEGLIKNGLAWVDNIYCIKSTHKKYKELQTEAKGKKIGLWKDKNPIPPWEWRKKKKPKYTVNNVVIGTNIFSKSIHIHYPKFEMDGINPRPTKIAWERIYKFLVEYPKVKLLIKGHVGSVNWTQEKLLELSQVRAEAVMQYLIDKGIDSKRLEAKGFGDTQPLSKENTKEAQSQNWRIEFEVISSEE